MKNINYCAIAYQVQYKVNNSIFDFIDYLYEDYTQEEVLVMLRVAFELEPSIAEREYFEYEISKKG